MFGEPENEEVKEQIAEKTEEITVYRKKNSRKKKAGIKKSMLDSIEKETIDIDIEEKDRICPECNSKLEKMGTEVVRQEIEYIPAKIKLVNYVRHSYKCTKCGKKDSEKETSTIIKPKVKNALLVHSFATPSLATEVIYKKYYMGVPLYRQEKVWEDIGLVLPRSMMANWCILKDYKGILITDGYSGYNDVGEINRAECWAHARRYFYEFE